MYRKIQRVHKVWYYSRFQGSWNVSPEDKEIGVMHYKSGDTWSCQKLADGRRDPHIEPLKGTWSCSHLDLGCLAVSNVRVCISTVLGKSYRQDSA